MDEDAGVRWVAMESLIHMGRASLRPLLDSFIKNFDSPWMREGLRHILRVFNDRNLLRNREIILFEWLCLIKSRKDLFEELEKQAIPGFDASWNSQQAWAAEKALEVLDQDAVQLR